MLLRVAAGLAANRSPENRWRLIAVPLSALVFMLLVHTATAVVLMMERQDVRDSGRSLNLSSTPRSTDLFVETDLDIWRGKRINVAWIEPSEPGVLPAVAAGMKVFPAPGEAVVSPELDRLARQHPALAARYPERTVLGEEGLRSGGELIAYIRPPAGRSIGGEANAAWIKDGQVVGEGPVVRAANLTGEANPTHTAHLFPSDSLPKPQFLSCLIVIVGLPALLVLGVGLASGSRLRDHRFQILAALGASRRTTLALGTLESLFLAVPALVLGSLIWAIGAGQFHSLPLTQYRLVTGDLSIGWPLLLASTGIGIILCALLAAAVSSRKLRNGLTRPSNERTRISPFAAAPFALTAVAFALAGATGDRSGNFRLLGLIGAVAGTPLIVPSILRAVGSALGESASMRRALVGRSLEWDPKRAARPFMGLATLLVVVFSISGIYSISKAPLGEYVGATTTGVRAVGVTWRDQAEGDLDRLTRAIVTGVVAPYRMGDGSAKPADGHRHEHGGHNEVPIQLGANCPDLAQIIATLRCDPSAPDALPPAMQHELQAVLSDALGEFIGEISLVGRDRLADNGTAIVLNESGLEALDERVRNAAVTTLPAPYVSSSIFNRRPPPQTINEWISAGSALAFLALSIGCLLALVDRMLATRQRHRHLLNLGMTPGWLIRFGATMFAIPYTIVSLVGLTTGLIICYWMVNTGGAEMPWGFVSGTLALVVVIGLIGTAAVALLGARATLRERE